MISIIIPVYNGESTISKCLESVTKQTYKDIEIIVVNDGSTDNTVDVVRSFVDKRIVLLNQENTGQGFARNSGLKQAKGDYVAFVDSDDTIEPNMLEVMYKTAISQKVDVVQCGINDIIDAQKKPRGLVGDACIKISDREAYAREYFMGLKHTNEVCNKLIRRQFLVDNNLHFSDTKVIFSEDFLMNMQMLSYIKSIAYVNGSFYNYYISTSGHCLGNLDRRLVQICRLFEVVFSDCKEEIIKPLQTVAARVIMQYSVTTQDIAVVKQVFRRDDVKQYFKTSCYYSCNIKHTIIMLLIRYLPFWAKIKIIKINNARYKQ